MWLSKSSNSVNRVGSNTMLALGRMFHNQQMESGFVHIILTVVKVNVSLMVLIE